MKLVIYFPKIACIVIRKRQHKGVGDAQRLGGEGLLCVLHGCEGFIELKLPEMEPEMNEYYQRMGLQLAGL